MTFISYSQNFEDVLLWRALKHVPQGFYIDVGANDPEEHSVTKAFYDAGWHGVNIEPMPSYHQVFEQARPRDINLAVACGAAEGSITLFDTPAINGWASTDSETARAHRAEGVEVVEIAVPLRTLSGIFAEHAAGRDVHFLKIDVEGFEGEVLRGMDFQRWRPWLLVIEATLPNSRVTNHGSWEQLVTAHDYHFAYFDGLNRYYVAGERPELAAALTVQANVFDDFIGHHLDKAWKRGRAADERIDQQQQAIDDAQARAVQAEQRIQALIEALRQAEQTQETIQGHANAAEISRRDTAEWAGKLERQLNATYASLSWRITRPVRTLGRLSRRGPDAGRALKARARSALRWLATRQAVRRAVLPILQRFPTLGVRVLRLWVTIRGAAPAAPAQPGVPPELNHLPQSARKVLADLRRFRSPSR